MGTQGRRARAYGRANRAGKTGFSLPQGGCTLLPALQNIQGLLRKDVNNDEQNIDCDADDTPSPLLSGKTPHGRASPRMYSNRRVPKSTSEFNDCLRLPAIMR